MGEKINVDKDKLLKAYKNASKTIQKEMEDFYGKEIFTLSPMERISSYMDACVDQGLDPKAELPWKTPETDDQEFDNANVKLRIIAKSLKGNTKVNWADLKEYKWRPWFEYNPGGSAFVFSVSYYGYSSTYTGVGSRLCFPTEALSDYYGKQFLDLHNIILLK